MSNVPIRPILEHLGFDLSSERNGRIRCALHGLDRHPSASVQDFYFKCFTCDAHGDAARLLVEHGGMDWKDAYRLAEELTGIGDKAIPGESASRGRISGRTGILRTHSKYIAPGRGRGSGDGR